MLLDLQPDQIEALIERLPTLPMEEKLALLQELELLEHKKDLQACRDDFLKFCLKVYPGFKQGPHHRHLKPLLQDMVIDDPAQWYGSEMPPHAKRLTVSMPPRFGKSETIAYLYVAWYLGHNPTHHIMMATHTAELSDSFGRKVRDLIDTPLYQEIFPDTQVSKDKSAAGNWTTTAGGKYLAIGIGANVAGHGAHLLVADDLVSEQAVLANPDAAFETAWRYMQVGPLQRLMPGGRIIMIGCMTAETRVLMADGAEKELQYIEVGDEIATYDAGRITTSKVTNWIKHPSDFVYRIRTTSGKIVRANKRHPFLVDRNGERAWVRVRDLKVGDYLVEAAQPQVVGDHTKQKVCALLATSENCGQKAALAHSGATGTGANGKVLSAPPTGATGRSWQKGFVKLATTPLRGVQASTVLPKSKSVPATSSTGTAFLRRLTTVCSKLRGAVVQFASSLLQRKTPERGSSPNCTSTTATTQTRYEGCSVTTATWPSDTQKQKSSYWPLPSTYVSTASAIVEIVEDGFEPVFDMEVERTENFIANGVVSHNTRWGKKDPIGRALAWAAENPDSAQWHEVRFPAIMEVERGGEIMEVSLWPEQWPLEQLLAKKAGMQAQFWAAQYMQEPTSEEGALIKREWWQRWQKDDPPDCEFVIQVWDTAHETKNYSDYSACLTWGVWFNEERNRHELILLNAYKGRLAFPQLKEKALDEYRYWEPDALLIEKKAAGAPLIQELRQMDMYIEELNPSRGARGVSNDKRARVNAVTPVFADGAVWAPEKRWADEVINECAEFPNGEHDDYCDCTEMAISRFRRGGFISLQNDRKEDNEYFAPRRAAYY